MGVIGPNGAGKTTLLRAVARLVPHEGTITVDGEEVSSLSPKRLARLVAYVPQQPELPPDMTVGHYVLLGRTPAHRVLRLRDRRGSPRVRRSPRSPRPRLPWPQRRLSTLSGGELQRLVLARALAQQAPVLLLDEPTSALDLGRRVEALELVDALRRERGLTVLSALHDLTLAGQFADRLMLLGEGRAVSTGKPDEVLTEESLARHFGASVRVMRSEDGDLVVVPQRVR